MHTPKPDMGSEDKAPQRTERRMHILPPNYSFGYFLESLRDSVVSHCICCATMKTATLLPYRNSDPITQEKNTDRLVSSFMKNPNV